MVSHQGPFGGYGFLSSLHCSDRPELPFRFSRMDLGLLLYNIFAVPPESSFAMSILAWSTRECRKDTRTS